MFIGTWVDGLVLFGHRPGRAGASGPCPSSTASAPPFATYAIHAGKALDRFARVLEERGATVVSRTLLRRDRLEAGIAAEFVMRRSTPSPRRVSAWGRPGPRPHDWGSLRAFLDPPNHPLGIGPGPRAGARRRGLRPWGRGRRFCRHRADSLPAPACRATPATGAARPPPPTLRTWRSTGRWPAADRTPLRPSRWPRSHPVRVAMTERTETVAPLLVAGALGELSAENLAVEIVDMPGPDAYAAMARGEVDIVVGGVDGPFFDAVHDGLGARLVLGGQVALTPATSAPRRRALAPPGSHRRGR